MKPSGPGSRYTQVLAMIGDVKFSLGNYRDAHKAEDCKMWFEKLTATEKKKLQKGCQSENGNKTRFKQGTKWDYYAGKWVPEEEWYKRIAQTKEKPMSKNSKTIAKKPTVKKPIKTPLNVDRRVAVWWGGDEKWYFGRTIACNNKGEYTVLYDDKTRFTHYFNADTPFQFVDEITVCNA